MPLDLSKLAAAATRATARARDETLGRFRQLGADGVERKADGTPVTEADRAAERVLREELGRALPEAALFGEEYGGERDAELLWVIDPIDGTLSYSRGIPLFATLVALLEAGRPVLGVIDLPALGECYVGWRGGGCWRGDERLRVSDCRDLAQALVSHGDPYCFDAAGERAAFEALAQRARVLRGYTDAFGHAQVLCAAVDVMVDLDLSLWDAAAAQVLVPEAGGRCETLAYPGDKVGLVLGAPALVDALVPLLGAAGVAEPPKNAG